MNAIEVSELSFGYTKKQFVLKNLEMQCASGSINVFLGLNGSGKTTLIKILAGLLKASSGEIFLNGKRLEELSISTQSKIMAYVAQHSELIDDFTVKDYLLFGKVNQIAFYRSPREEDIKNVEVYAEKFNVTKFLDKKLGELSGGERQIVSICAAVIQNTEIIILDEPTSALDIKNQHSILSLLREISKQENKTILLSSHNPNHALYLDCNVFLMKDGAIFGSGSAREMITIEKLKPIYGEDVCLSSEQDYSEISFKDYKENYK